MSVLIRGPGEATPPQTRTKNQPLILRERAEIAAWLSRHRHGTNFINADRLHAAITMNVRLMILSRHARGKFSLEISFRQNDFQASSTAVYCFRLTTPSDLTRTTRGQNAPIGAAFIMITVRS